MRYSIVGAGVAGLSAAAKIRSLDHEAEIDVFTDETYPFYARTRLPEVIAGDSSLEDLVIHAGKWYVDRNIKLHTNEMVVEVDSTLQEIVTVLGRYKYSSLLLATGSRSFIPPIKGAEKKGVLALRSMADALATKEWASRSRKAVLIGGGLLGLEAGNGLRRAGLNVTVVEVFPRLLPRQMDVPGAAVLQRQMEEMGFSFLLGLQSQEIIGNDVVEALSLSNGEELCCDLILVSAGVRPNMDLAKAIGLATDRGVVVDDSMRTSAPNIFAAGDSTEHRGSVYGIWPASQRQGEVAGANMVGGQELFQGIVPSNRLKVLGIDLVSAGDIDVENQCEAFVSETATSYRKIVLRDGAIVGCVLLGDSKGASAILNAIEKKAHISKVKDQLGEKDFDFKRLLQ